MGSNGSGRTTTLRAHLGIHQTTAGILHIGGKAFDTSAPGACSRCRISRRSVLPRHPSAAGGPMSPLWVRRSPLNGTRSTIAVFVITCPKVSSRKPCYRLSAGDHEDGHLVRHARIGPDPSPTAVNHSDKWQAFAALNVTHGVSPIPSAGYPASPEPGRTRCVRYRYEQGDLRRRFVATGPASAEELICRWRAIGAWMGLRPTEELVVRVTAQP